MKHHVKCILSDKYNKTQVIDQLRLHHWDDVLDLKTLTKKGTTVKCWTRDIEETAPEIEKDIINDLSGLVFSCEVLETKGKPKKAAKPTPFIEQGFDSKPPQSDMGAFLTIAKKVFPRGCYQMSSEDEVVFNTGVELNEFMSLDN